MRSNGCKANPRDDQKEKKVIYSLYICKDPDVNE